MGGSSPVYPSVKLAKANIQSSNTTRIPGQARNDEGAAVDESSDSAAGKIVLLTMNEKNYMLRKLSPITGQDQDPRDPAILFDNYRDWRSSARLLVIGSVSRDIHSQRKIEARCSPF